MSISFACDCGKGFTVADEYAGKRTKCPACGSGLTVPAPEVAPGSEALSDEDKAFQALAEAPDPEPSAAPARRDPPADAPPPRRGPPAPAPIPGAKRPPQFTTRTAEEDDRPRGTSGIHITPAVMGGLFSMLIGGAWCAYVFSNNRITLYGPILFLGGLVAVVRGLLGYSED